MPINPFPEATLLPILRPDNWEGASALRSRLIRTEKPLQHNLWISFAYSTESKLYTVTKESLKAHGQQSKDLVVEALKNLEALNFEWEISARRSDGTAAVLTCEHEFAAESVLLPNHLTEAQAILGVQEIAIAVPVAGCTTVQTAHPAHRNELDQLMTWAHDNYMNATGRTLTPNLLTAQMGQIRSMYCNPLTDQKLKEEQPVLQPIGYDDESQVLTFRADSPDLSLWEIERLRVLLKTQFMADGRRISRLRIVAADPVQAQILSIHLQHLDIEVYVVHGEETVPFTN